MEREEEGERETCVFPAYMSYVYRPHSPSPLVKKGKLSERAREWSGRKKEREREREPRIQVE